MQRICEEGCALNYGIGHILSTKNIVPDRVLIILQGKARLLAKASNKLTTIRFLKEGSLVGLASLLRAQGCEEVSASTEVTAWTIPDTLIAEIYGQDKGFSHWCKTNIFEAEVADLLTSLIQQAERETFMVNEIFAEAMQKAAILDSKAISSNRIESNEVRFIASENLDIRINSVVTEIQNLPKNQGEFDLRVLTFPLELVEKLDEEKTRKSVSLRLMNRNPLKTLARLNYLVDPA